MYIQDIIKYVTEKVGLSKISLHGEPHKTVLISNHERRMCSQFRHPINLQSQDGTNKKQTY